MNPQVKAVIELVLLVTCIGGSFFLGYTLRTTTLVWCFASAGYDPYGQLIQTAPTQCYPGNYANSTNLTGMCPIGTKDIRIAGTAPKLSIELPEMSNTT